MNDSLIRTFCKERNLTYRWRTRTEGGRAYAEIEVRQGKETLYTVANNCLSSEQHVLDNVMRWAIEHFTEVKHDPIVGFGPRGPSRAP